MSHKSPKTLKWNPEPRGALGLQIGHAGTLDPLATGLLIVCTGKGTKRVDSFVAMDKVALQTAALQLHRTCLDR